MLEAFFLVFLTIPTRATKFGYEWIEQDTQVCFSNIVANIFGLNSEEFWIFFFRYYVFFLTIVSETIPYLKKCLDILKKRLGSSKDLR